MNVVVNGLMTNYQKTGGGKTLLLLHGWGDTSATFSKLAEQLQSEYTILVLDLPGFGGTQAPPEAWGLEEYAKFIASWLEKIKANEIYGLVGHSYGGSIAILGVADNILRPKKLILVGSSGVRDIYRLRRNLLKGSAQLAKLPLYLLPQNKQQGLKRKAYKALGSDALLLPHMELSFKRIIGQDLQQAASQISVPTLLIYGDKDKSTPVKYGQLFNKAITGSKLEVIPSAGHFLHQQQPEKTAELITGFLEAK